MLGKSAGQKPKKKKMTVKESHEILINEESYKLIEQDKIIKQRNFQQKIMELFS